ncbi:MAG: hypothetical protein ACOZQL_07975 [Myxococcota bacterium]
MRPLLLLSALAWCACGPVDLVVVSVADAGGLDPMATPCADNAQCMAGQFCQKDSCTAALGKCVARPALCDGNIQLECGCDGITYGNDCLRRAAGVAANSNPGECTQKPLLCDSLNPCPGDAYCARLFRRDFDCAIGPGRCFVLPDVACTGAMFPPFVPCSGPRVCQSWCAAVRSEQPMAVPPRGTCP